MKLAQTKYHVYKVFGDKRNVFVATYETRNEARRLEQLLLNSEHRSWTPEIFTEIVPENQ